MMNKITNNGLTSILMALFFSIFIVSCSKDEDQIDIKKTADYDSRFLIQYYDLTCSLLKETPGFFPPQSARAYGYIALAGYESVVWGIGSEYSMQNQITNFNAFALPKPLKGLDYHWAISANAATAQMMRYMFEKKISTSNQRAIDSLESKISDAFNQNVDPITVERSKLFGKNIADVVFAYSKTDGGHEGYLDPFQLPFALPTGPHVWQPTGATVTPLSPRWGKNRPFILDNVERTISGPNAPYSEDPNSDFYKEAMVVYQQSKKNTFDEIQIAKFWADDPFVTCTPAGHSFNIMSQLLFEEKASLAMAATAMCKLGIAENDAFIACWKGKYDYMLLRHVTYIRKVIDPSFNTLLASPPFPSYTSGHSCESAAASRILTSTFSNGSGNYFFTDYSQLRHGLYVRNFKNFNEMSLECANSRLYGGIHYPMDNINGLHVGNAVGDNVNKNLHWPEF